MTGLLETYKILNDKQEGFSISEMYKLSSHRNILVSNVIEKYIILNDIKYDFRNQRYSVNRSWHKSPIGLYHIVFTEPQLSLSPTHINRC